MTTSAMTSPLFVIMVLLVTIRLMGAMFPTARILELLGTMIALDFSIVAMTTSTVLLGIHPVEDEAEPCNVNYGNHRLQFN